MIDKITLSIIIPVYGVDECLDLLCSKLINCLSQLTESFEIILVNDASPNNAWEYIVKNNKKDNRIKGINLSRNFGQYEAISAGLLNSKGTWTVIMDCDLQDRPEEINRLYHKAKEGFDIVFGLRTNRKDNVFRKFASFIFSKTLTFLTGVTQDTRISHFGIYNRNVINAVLSMKDRNRYFQTMVKWVGFKEAYIEVQHDKRHDGKSSYSYFKLFKLGFNTLLSFSNKPLYLMVQFGAILSGSAFIYAFITFVQAYMGTISVSGWASLMISIWFLTGINILFLGIVGIYIGRIFDQVKQRPIFIIKETTEPKDCNYE